MYTYVIWAHAAAGVIAVLAGLVAVPAGRLLSLHRISVLVMALALVPAILLGWATTAPLLRVVFLGLLALAVLMVVRAERAGRARPGPSGPTAGYIEHLGFNLIALADGFFVVAALRAGAPGWVVAMVAIGVVVIGHVAIRAARRRLV